jgi:hypothetical protein
MALYALWGAEVDMKNLTAVICLSALVILVLSIPVRSQEPGPLNKSYAAWAQDFVRAMYPSLNDKKYVLSVDEWAAYDEPGAQARWLSLSVGEGPQGQYSKIIGGYAGFTPPPRDFHPGPQYFKQYLKAGFAFDEDDRLISFSASGVAVENSEVEGQCHDFLASHPSLTQNETNAALLRLGVKYGPGDKEAFEQNLPLKELSRFLGKIEMVSVSPVPDCVSPSGVVQWVTWNVTFRILQSDGTRLPYLLFFDPFNGELTSVLTGPLAALPSASK